MCPSCHTDLTYENTVNILCPVSYVRWKLQATSGYWPFSHASRNVIYGKTVHWNTRTFHNWVYSALILHWTFMFTTSIVMIKHCLLVVVMTPLKISLIISTQQLKTEQYTRTCSATSITTCFRTRTHLWSNQKSSRGYSHHSNMLNHI